MMATARMELNLPPLVKLAGRHDAPRGKALLLLHYKAQISRYEHWMASRRPCRFANLLRTDVRERGRGDSRNLKP